MSKVVLLVEDNNFIRNMYQLKLAKADLTVIEAIDGKMALERITEQKPDLVLLDLMMPNVGGLEVLRDLNKQGLLPELPVIVLTNVMDPQTIDQAKELGAKDYIVKTDLTPSQVIDKLKPFIK
ncbi:MAG TPA: response regulator [Candidatus Saccharibacteria bacterium]|nr:response regulator [Candidatus Saccharibacteria bacterium]HMT39868.1 response regulator [Candidatus Saccharibacteria bacterium]